MLRMLIIGYVFAIRSERQLVREVQVNLAYRWVCWVRCLFLQNEHFIK